MIQNFIVDYNKTTKINSIEFCNIEPINSFSKRIKFFNPEVSEPLHKFWYFISNAKILKKNNGLIDIVLSSNDKNLIKSIQNLDYKTSEIIDGIHIKCKLESSIHITPNFPPVFALTYDSNTKSFNSENNQISCMDIKIGSKVQLYVEFDCIILGSNGCSRRWRVIQIKEMESINLSVNLFEKYESPPQKNDHGPINMQNAQMPHTPHTPHTPQVPRMSQLPKMPQMQQQMQQQIQQMQQQMQQSVIRQDVGEKSGGFKAPSQSELLDMISKLKKKTPIDTSLNKMAEVKTVSTNKKNTIDIQYIKKQEKILNNNRQKLKGDIVYANKVFKNLDKVINNKMRSKISLDEEDDPFEYKK